MGVNDETDEEIYPEFALKHDLQMHFLGQIIEDIKDNTKYQLQNPTEEDFLKNFNYYNKHDSFFDF